MTRALGIQFFQGSATSAAEQALAGGLTVAPSGPGLAELDRQPAYQRALNEADLVVVDSGFLVLCWKLKSLRPLSRLSGLLLLETILASGEFKNTSPQLWVMPTASSIQHTRDYLTQCGGPMSEVHFYEAPFYSSGEIEDPQLLELIQNLRPKLVVINVAGGKQEVLGAWLKRSLDAAPATICTGAAIAFLTGEQANIPKWGDRFYLGWLLRILNKPKQYLPRYKRAWRLLPLVLKYGDRAPKPKSHVSH